MLPRRLNRQLPPRRARRSLAIGSSAIASILLLAALASPSRASAAEPRPPSAPFATSLFELTLDGGGGNRRFRFWNGIAPTAYKSRWTAAPVGGLEAHLFPFAKLLPPWRDVGLVAHSSVVDVGGAVRGPLSPVAIEYAGGLRGRANPFTDGRLLLGLSLEYAFAQVGATGAPTAELPGVAYRTLRATIDARLTFGRVAVFGAAAGEQPVQPSTLSPGFDSPRGYGLSGEAGVGFLVGRYVDLRLIARYRRMMFSLTPPPGALFGHGSAIDETYDARLAVAFYFEGY